MFDFLKKLFGKKEQPVDEVAPYKVPEPTPQSEIQPATSLQPEVLAAPVSTPVVEQPAPQPEVKAEVVELPVVKDTKVVRLKVEKAAPKAPKTPRQPKAEKTPKAPKAEKVPKAPKAEKTPKDAWPFDEPKPKKPKAPKVVK